MFLGFLAGTLCLVGLVRTVAGHGFRHRYGWAPFDGPWAYGGGGGRGCGPRPGGWGRFGGAREGWGPFGGGRGDFADRGRYRGRPDALGVVHMLLERLDATPAQERAILSAVDEVRRTVRELRSDAQQAREDLARALREPVLNQDAVSSARAHVESATRRIGDALTAALTEIHGILDDRQRRMLGDVIASSWSSRW